MKSFASILKSFSDMKTGNLTFANSMIIPMQTSRLWGNLFQAYKITIDEITYYICIGGSENMAYYKDNGKKYCVSFYVQKNDDVYLKGCLGSYTQKEIQPIIERYRDEIINVIDDRKIIFDNEFEKAVKNYPWQTSKPNQ